MLNRREFARAVTTQGILPAALVGMATGNLASDEETPENSSEPPPRKPELEELLLAALMLRYPEFSFTPERLAGLKADIRHKVHQGKQLRRFPLRNSDEPATIFQALQKKGENV